MSKYLKILLISIGVFAALLVFAIGGLLIYVRTDHAALQIQSQINKQIAGKILFEGHQLSISKGKIELDNVLIKDEQDQTLVGIEHLMLRVSLSDLFTRNVAIKNLLIKNPQVRLVLDSDGNLNLAGAFAARKDGDKPREEEQPSEGRSSMNLIIESFVIEDGSFTWVDHSRDTRLGLNKIRFNCSGNVKGREWRVDLAAGDGKYSSGEKQAAVDSLKLSGGLKQNRVDDLNLELKTASSDLKVAASARNIYSEPFVDFGLDLDLDLPELAAALALGLEMTGKVDGRIGVEGSLNNPEINLNLAHSGGILEGLKLESLKLEAFLKNKVVHLAQLHAASGKGSLEIVGESDLGKVFPEGFLNAPESFDLLSYDIHLTADQIQLRKIIGEPFQGGGRIDGSMEVKGEGIDLRKASARTRLKLKGEAVSAGDWKPIDISLASKVSIELGKALFETLKIEAGPTTISADGQLNVLSQEIEVELEADSSNLSETLSPLAIEGVEGEMTIHAKVSGPLKKPFFILDCNGKNLGLEKWRIGDLNLSASLDKTGVLKVSELELENNGSFIEGEGTVQLFPSSLEDESIFKSIQSFNNKAPADFHLSLQKVRPENFGAAIPVSGTVSGSLQIGGDLENLTADLALEAKELSAKENRIGDVDLSATLEKGIVHVQKAIVNNGNSSITASGNVGMFEKNSLKTQDDPPVNLTLRADPLYIQDFTDQIKARISLNAEVEGSVNHPRGDFELIGEEIDLGGQKLQGLLLTGGLMDRKIKCDNLNVNFSEGQTVSGSGWVSLDKTYSIQITTKGVSLSQIEKLREQNAWQGLAMIDFSGQGSFENPNLSGEAVIKNLRFKDKNLGDFRIDLRLAESAANLTGKLNFDMDASYHLKDKNFSLTLDFNETDLSPYFQIAGLSSFSGLISGRARASGNAAEIKEMEGFADINMLDVFVGDRELAHAENFAINLKDQRAAVSDLKLRVLQEGNLNLDGIISLAGDVSFNAEGKIPLEGVKLVSETLPDISGTLELKADVTGTSARPNVEGGIILNDIGFTIPGLFQKLHGLNGKIILSPDAFRIENIRGKLDSGRFEMNGKMGLKDFKPGEMKLDFSARALPLRVPDTLEILLQSDLNLSGTLNKSLLRGEAVILEGVYYKDIQASLVEGVTKKKRAVSPKKPKSPNPTLEKLELDIAVKRRNPFFVDNNLAYLEINPDLRIAGNAANPSVRGRTTIEEGTIRYQKKEFTVQKGVIDFLNPYEPEPTLDIVSTVNIRKWLITLTVSGTPDNLLFKLTSDPPEEDGDIISLLVLGKTTRELISSEGGTKQSAEQMLTEMLASTFSEDIKQLTGLDYIEVDAGPEEESDEDSEGVKVTVGKDLSERLTVKYSVDSRTGEMVQRAISEYKLLENIILSGFQASDGVFGGEIQYRLEFR